MPDSGSTLPASDSKTPQKTARRPRNGGAALPLGAHPGNTGGKKGRSGRRPERLVHFIAELRRSPDFHAALENAAYDHNSKHFNAILKLVAEYDDEKPAEKRQIVGPVEVRVRIARESRKTTAG